MNNKPPSCLDSEGKAFWRKHYQHCVDNGSLTDVTASSFELLARMWSVVKRCDPDEDSKAALKFCGLIKQVQAMAKPFGLLGSKPPAGPAKASIADIIRQAVQGPPTASTGQPGAKDAH